MMKIGPAAIALLILGFHSGPGLAQSDDDDEAPPTEAPMTVAPKSEPDQLIHRHAGGDDNERPAGLLRGNPNEVTRLESTAGTGLAMDHSMLPGELGGSPEPSRPLFSKPSTSLAIQPDPWALKAK